MTRIVNKWYFSMIIIPIILTYLTSYFNLPKIFNNWKNSIITSLIILIAILIYELITLKKMLVEQSEKPKDNDKKIVKRLLDGLDLDTFHEDIYEQDAWYGYSKDAISCVMNFTMQSRLIKNKTSDKKLNILISNLTKKLNDFQEYSSIRLFGDRTSYVPNKENGTREKIKLESLEMNRMTKESFFELEKLTDYLKKKEYI